MSVNVLDDFIGDIEQIPADIPPLFFLQTGLELTDDDLAKIKSLHNEIFPKDSEWIKDSKGAIIACSITQIILYITQPEPDENTLDFQDEFLRTFPSFATPRFVLGAFYERFFSDPNEFDSYETFQKVQNRVIGLIQRWIRIAVYQFTTIMVKSIESFSSYISQHSDQYSKFAKILGSILARLKGKTRGMTATIIREEEIQLPPGPPDTWTILALKAEELSHQITLLNFNMFHDISSFELLSGIWGDEKGGGCPHLNVMVDYFNNFSNYIQQSILSEDNLTKRASIYYYWANLASQFYNLKNFYGVFMVVSALTHPSIKRLAQTREIAQTFMAQMEFSFDHLLTICDFSNDFANYRNEIRNKNPDLPAIPYIGCFQKDLIYIQETFSNKYQDTTLINFIKCRRCFDLIKELEAFQNKHYNFKAHDVLQQLIQTLPPPMGLADLMRKSQSITQNEEKLGPKNQIRRKKSLKDFFHPNK